MPVGTGRLLPLYQHRQLEVVGVDASDDMLGQTRRRAESLRFPLELQRAGVTSLPYPSEAFDAAICYRLLTLLPRSAVEPSLAELARVSRRWVLLTGHLRLPVLAVPRSGGPREMLHAVRGRRARSDRLHTRRYWHAAFAHAGLRPVQETVLHEWPGVRHSVAWLLEKT